MMGSTNTLLLLLITCSVYCQYDQSVDDLISQIYAPKITSKPGVTTVDPETAEFLSSVFPPNTAITEPATNKPVTPATVQPVKPTTTEDDASPSSEAACQMESGEKGVCVLHYQCDPASSTINTDGAGLVDLRKKACQRSLEVCCLQNKVNNTAKPKLPPPEQCGWGKIAADSVRIQGGGESLYGEYPYAVALLKRSEDGPAWSQSDYLGGGTIIHPSVVLTAAHKVMNFTADQLKLRAGEWDTQTTSESYPHQERNVKKIIRHEAFYRPSVYNSVALLVLEQPFDLKSNLVIGVGCVGTQLPADNTMCQVMGWGKGDQEQFAVRQKKLEIPLVNRGQCQKALRGTILGTFFELDNSLTCAGGNRGKDTCTKDGGFPLVCPINPVTEPGRFAVYGMVAYGIRCGDDGIPGVYVNVPEFKEWIDRKMTEEGFGTDSYKY